jgi:hypothetical protein
MPFLFLISSIMCHAQDIIVKTNGQKVYGKVLEVDTSRVYYIISDTSTKISLSKSEVREIRYSAAGSDYKGALTIGFLDGGGSLIGFDCERLISKSVGIQLGFGAIGFGFGLNKHFKPTVRSSFLSLQYWHQGLANSYTQSLIGPSIVVRNNTWFTFQIGLGYALGKGPAWPENKTQSPIMLTYAIGAYFPSH